jgi:hypothetical protein
VENKQQGKGGGFWPLECIADSLIKVYERAYDILSSPTDRREHCEIQQGHLDLAF